MRGTGACSLSTGTLAPSLFSASGSSFKSVGRGDRGGDGSGDDGGLLKVRSGTPSVLLGRASSLFWPFCAGSGAHCAESLSPAGHLDREVRGRAWYVVRRPSGRRRRRVLAVCAAVRDRSCRSTRGSWSCFWAR